MNRDEIIYAVQNVKHRRLRSFLSVLSILIGITAIFSIASFGWGLQHYINSLAEEAGTDKFYIQSKGTGAPGLDDTFYLTRDEMDYISKVRGVDEIMGMYAKVGMIEFEEQTEYAFAIGYSPDKQGFIEEIFAMDIIEGGQLKDGDTNKVLLGYNYIEDKEIFTKGIKAGDNIKIDGIEFEVEGIYEEVGNPQDDSNIYLTEKGFEMLHPESKDRFAYLMGSAESSADIDRTAERIEDELRDRRGVEEGKEDFYVLTFQDALETFGSILDIINGSLLLIALISIFVATVNIMNTMYTAVIERTKEIGIMKAVGARNRDILFVFMFESGLLGMIGGIFGVGAGYLISTAGGKIAADAGYSMLTPVFPWYLTLGCILFAFAVGAGAGILPARQASRLRPVDALRYE